MYHQIRELSTAFEIIFIALTDEEVPEDHEKILSAHCKSVHIFKLGKFSIFINILNGLFYGLPIQVAYFFNKSVQQKIYKIIDAVLPDHIYVQLIRSAEYVKHISIEKTLDYMDCFSMNSAKRAETSQGISKLFWKWESKKVKKYEADIYPYYTNHTIISAADESQMPETCKPISIIPNGIDIDFFNIGLVEKRDIDLLFVGNLSYYSNIDAVQFLIKNIIPYLSKSLKIVIAGSNPSATVLELASGNTRVELMPDVIDIKSVYNRAKIFLAPITKGTGMQNKILEALASGCEVICSKEVSDGLGFKLNTIHIATNASAYVSEIGILLSHFESHLSQRENGIKYIEKEFNWHYKTKLLIDIINKVKI